MRKTKTESYELVKDLISKKDFEKEIKKRFEEYDQLLDEDAIAFLITDEMGRNVGHVSTIRELKDNEEVTVYATVTKIFEPRIFEKNGKKGKVVNLEIKDETGECRLVLWDRDVEFVEKGVITDSSILKVVNGHVKKTENWFEINIGKWGMIIPESEDATEFAKKEILKINFTDLSDVKPGMNVNVTGALIGKDGPKSFVRKNGSTGFVSNIILYDGKDSARVVLWDERAKETANLETGDNVEIRNGYTKSDNGAEIHVGSRGTIKKR